MPTGVDALLDPLLALGVVWVAWASLNSPDLFRAAVLFIAFGLLMALSWVRLEAPDIALAEAAIGAGITGALLLDAVAQTGGRAPDPKHAGLGAAVALLAAAGVAGVLLVAVTALPGEGPGLTALASAELGRSGVSNPVTAVLLNFRAYDTWLEIVVLFVAVLSVLVLRRSFDLSDVGPVAGADDPMLRGMTRLLLPVMVLAGGYLLWRGTHAPGGAFQSGAVLGSAGILVLLTGRWPGRLLADTVVRGVLLAGSAAFLLLALALLLSGRPLLALDPAHAGVVILVVEAAVTVSIAVTLVALFAAARLLGADGGEGEVPR
jgi:multisubunit Na+/H+ antiporter MnhB subunit